MRAPLLAALAAMVLLCPGALHAQPPSGPAVPLQALAPAPSAATSDARTLTAPPGAGAPLPNCPPDKDLCVQADRTGGIDLKTGVARLEGNVRGLMRSRQLTFRSETLTAYRDGGKEWKRLVLDEHVHVTQRDQESDSDHGVLDHDEVRLSGHVRMQQSDLRVEGSQARIRADGSRTEVNGDPMTLVVNRALLAPPAKAPAKGQGAAPPAKAPPEGQGSAPPVTTTLRAEKAVIEGSPKHAELTGNVHVEQSDGGLIMDAETVTLQFTANSRLASFVAQGHVVIAQPERRITADFAQSRDQLKTILLVGHATMQQTGQFELQSQRMVVYADASKGVMQTSGQQKPITLTMDLNRPTYRLTQPGMLQLAQANVPSSVLGKLTPLIGHSYRSRDALKKAVTARLTPGEARAHMQAILDTARQPAAAR